MCPENDGVVCSGNGLCECGGAVCHVPLLLLISSAIVPLAGLVMIVHVVIQHVPLA